MQETSGVSSQDITPTSSLLRAHAPNRCPPAAFDKVSCGQVFAGCCQPLLRSGPSRRYLCRSFLACLDQYSGCSQVARARFFPWNNGLPPARTGSAQMHQPDNYFHRIGISKLQSFANVQTHKVAGHTDSSHPRVLRRRAAVAFTSARITGRYLAVQRICSPPKSGQLTVRGLAPLKIGSLVGCSPRLPDAGQPSTAAGQPRDLPVPVQGACAHARFYDHAGSGRRSR
jgi:hypothetical protein